MTERDPEFDERHHMPRPTAWPITLAAGVTLLALGLITDFFIAGSGAILFAFALVGWIRQLIGESNPYEPHRYADGGLSEGGQLDV